MSSPTGAIFHNIASWPVLTFCRIAWNISKWSNKEVPKTKRYKIRAVIKGKSKKEAPRKKGEKGLNLIYYMPH